MKPKYKINPETLHYEKIESKSNFSFNNVIWIILSGVAFGFVLIILISYFYPTMEERQLRKDLNVLEDNYENLNSKIQESILIYDNLVEKEKEIQQLTFDAEIEELKSLSEEIVSYSKDFNSKNVIGNVYLKICESSETMSNLIWKINVLLDISFGKKIFLEHVPSVLPIDKSDFVLVSGFGNRIHPFFKTLRKHNGIDLAARQGIPVYATGAGVVIDKPYDLEGFGNIVAIDHGFGYVSIYACLLKTEVRRGKKVNRGDVVGYVGRSGIASGPHLHYEIRKNDVPVDPINYFFMSLKPNEIIEYKNKASIQNQSMS